MIGEFKIPSRQNTESGKERDVGYEFEYSGVDTGQTADIIVQLYGGQIQTKNRFDLEVAKTELGEFSVSLDARTVKNEKYLEVLKAMGINTDDQGKLAWWEDLVENVATLAVPYEIGCPPVAISKLSRLEELRDAMLRHDAGGTKVRPHYAFGMHLNPEVPDISAVTTVKVLKSFLIHYPWLLKKLEIDWARRVAPFINPFPDEYVALVLDSAYWPDEAKFTDDYLKYNPTRNRPLDLLPILSTWNGEKIRLALPKDKVKPRPTYHYRMPNCLFDDPTWTLSRDWNYWVMVEETAWNQEKLDNLGTALLEEMKASPLRWASHWVDKMEKLDE